MLLLSGRIAPNRHVPTKNQIRPSDRQEFRSDVDCRQRVVAWIISKLPDLPLQPISISEMVESFTKDIIDSVEPEVPPPPRRTHKLGWCETVETSAAFTIAWDAREEARRFVRVNPRDKSAWKTLRTACANLRGMIDAGLQDYFEEHLSETERLLVDNDQRGFSTHLNGTVGLGGRKVRSEQSIMDKDGTLLGDKLRIRKRWEGFFQTLLNKKSPKLDPTMSALFPKRPLAPSIGDEPTMDNMTRVIRGMPNWEAVEPDFLPANY